MKVKDCYIGIDIGTTHIKAGVYDGNGGLQAIAKTSTPTHITQDGGSYYLANEIWESTLTCLRSCLEKVNGENIRAIGISSMAESGVLMDEQNEPIGPILTWHDPRPKSYIKIINQVVSNLDMYRRTGLFPLPKYPLLKFLWMRENMSDTWGKGHSWLHMAEYIAFCLTGEKRTEISLASRTMLFDIKKKKWDQELIQAFGINRKLLQPVIQSGELVGRVSKKASKLALISEGTPVTVAGHDHLVGSYGVGSTQKGDITNSCGTAETLVLTLQKLRSKEIDQVPDYPMGCHVASNRFYAMLSVGKTGGIIESFLSMNNWNYEHFLSALSTKVYSNNPFRFIPCPLRDGVKGDDGQMAWIGGNSANINKEQMATEIILGISCLFRYQFEILLQSLNMKMNRLIVIGGATRNPFWMQAKADIINKPLHVIENSEAVTRGAALLAAQMDETNIKMPKPSSYTVMPNKENTDKLNAYYNGIYKKNVNMLKNMVI